MKENFFSAMAGGTIWLVLLTVCGWSVIKTVPPSRPHLTYPDKHALKRYTAQNLAEHTHQYNSMMEARGLVHDVKKVR